MGYILKLSVVCKWNLRGYPTCEYCLLGADICTVECDDACDDCLARFECMTTEMEEGEACISLSETTMMQLVIANKVSHKGHLLDVVNKVIIKDDYY